LKLGNELDRKNRAKLMNHLARKFCMKYAKANDVDVTNPKDELSWLTSEVLDAPGILGEAVDWGLSKLGSIWNWLKGKFTKHMVAPAHELAHELIGNVSDFAGHAVSGLTDRLHQSVAPTLYSTASAFPTSPGPVNYVNGFSQGDFQQKVRVYAPSQYSMTAVNAAFVASVIAPRSGQERAPVTSAVKTALAGTVQLYNIVTDSNGNAFAYVFPQALLAPAITQVQCTVAPTKVNRPDNCFVITNGTAPFDPLSGVYPLDVVGSSPAFTGA